MNKGIGIGGCLLLPALLCAQQTVHLKPEDHVAAMVQKAPPGTTFVFSPGVYRMQQIEPKDNDVFQGEEGAVLNGSKILQFQPEGAHWVATEARSQAQEGHCSDERPRCWMWNDVFVDGELQVPVGREGDLRPGRWYYDDNAGRVILGSNPTGHTVEISKSAAAFFGTASGVEISHLVVEKYANPPQSGAVGGNNGRTQGWKIDHVEARWNHGAGIATGPGGFIDSCDSHHNGQLGLAGHGANITVQNTTLAYNNYAGYKTNWEAGGAKFSQTDHLVLRGNDAHDNAGVGLWTDIDNVHVLMERNRCVNNREAGIAHEISYDAVIRNNLVKGNKDGILVVLSSNVDVYGNVVVVPNDGIDWIRVANGYRGEGMLGPHIAHDVRVHENTIIYEGQGGRTGLSGPLDTAVDVKFENNQYYARDGGAHWLWGGNRPISFGEYRRSGADQRGGVSKGAPEVVDPTRQ